MQVSLMGGKLHFLLWNKLQRLTGFYDEWQGFFINPWMIVLADQSKSIYRIGIYLSQNLMPLQNYRASQSSTCYQEVTDLFENITVWGEVMCWTLYCGGKVEPLWTSISGMMVPLYMDPLNKYWSIWGRMLPDIQCINYLPIWVESFLKCGCLSMSI